MLTVYRSAIGLDVCRRTCDVAGCAAVVPSSRWPSGAYDGGGFHRAVGPRVGNTRMSYDVCPACAAAGKLPLKAENPQPWPTVRS